MEELQQQNLTLLDNIIVSVHNIKTIGVNIIENLNTQGEVLNEIDTKLTEIEIEIEKGDEALNKMSCFGNLLDKFNIFKYFRKKKLSRELIDKQREQHSQRTQPKYPIKEFNTYEQQEQDKLDVLTTHIDELKSIALDIGHILDNQNEKLDDMNNSSGHVKERLRRVNNKVLTRL